MTAEVEGLHCSPAGLAAVPSYSPAAGVEVEPIDSAARDELHPE
jgi:hypothetical protein